MIRIDDDPQRVIAALVSIETQEPPFPGRTWSATDSVYRQALDTLLRDQEGGEKHSIPAAHAFWLEHRDEPSYIPFSIYGLGGMNRYFVLQSGEIVLSGSHLPRGAGNAELRELYQKQAQVAGVRVQ